MNKLTKAAIAGAAGIALLLGGAGTLAYWNDSADLTTGSSITAGNLTVTATGTAAWKNGSTAIANIDNYRIVPGDTLTYTQEVTVVAQGDTLKATLGLSPTAIKAKTSSAADSALKGYLTDSAAFSIGTSTPGVTVSGNTVTFAPGATGINVVLDLEVTITFDNGAAGAENTAKTGVVSLDDFSVVLTQTF